MQSKGINFIKIGMPNVFLETKKRLILTITQLPGKQVIDPTTGKVIEVLSVKSGFLTKAEFVELYKACGSVLHAEIRFRLDVSRRFKLPRE
jgi:hypothetical protein